MAKLKTVTDEKLEKKDAPSLIWIKVSDAVNLLWEENPKLHDIGSVIESIKKHGFQELPKYDKNLLNVSGTKGAVKAGNGRVEALDWMQRDGSYDLPRGLAVIKASSEWCMPILIGTDAESIDLARAYAIDSNNLTLTGGDFTAYEMARLWSPEGYLKLLTDMAESRTMPVSVDEEDVQFFLEGLKFDLPDYSGIEDEEIGEVKVFRIVIGDPMYLEDALSTVRQLITDNNEWQASIEL